MLEAKLFFLLQRLSVARGSHRCFHIHCQPDITSDKHQLLSNRPHAFCWPLPRLHRSCQLPQLPPSQAQDPCSRSLCPTPPLMCLTPGAQPSQGKCWKSMRMVDVLGSRRCQWWKQMEEAQERWASLAPSWLSFQRAPGIVGDVHGSRGGLECRTCTLPCQGGTRAGCEAPNKELPRIVVRRGTFSGLPAPSPTLLSSGNHGARAVPPLR